MQSVSSVIFQSIMFSHERKERADEKIAKFDSKLETLMLR